VKNPPSTYASQAFKDLQAKWYRKLERTGFKDLEDKLERLKEYSTTKWKEGHPAKARQQSKEKQNDHFLAAVASKEEYYRAAGHWLYDHKFDKKVEFKVWELHAEGATARQIYTKLRLTKNEVRSILHKLTRLFKHGY
jgi:hypothetical protein